MIALWILLYLIAGLTAARLGDFLYGIENYQIAMIVLLWPLYLTLGVLLVSSYGVFLFFERAGGVLAKTWRK